MSFCRSIFVFTRLAVGLDEGVADGVGVGFAVGVGVFVGVLVAVVGELDSGAASASALACGPWRQARAPPPVTAATATAATRATKRPFCTRIVDLLN
ncbi:hypothetical protein E0H50_26120 [Kribbella sindirgiensis]|uniref:Uncharacterized protein n=1 Tax=Kribbella sindirgiensis TaxID=1124744 RepID=A0A4V2M2X8_9ACTN|nr:hypothetical protein E0H50_26120 [Kribbella sindirgiensis]